MSVLGRRRGLLILFSVPSNNTARRVTTPGSLPPTPNLLFTFAMISMSVHPCFCRYSMNTSDAPVGSPCSRMAFSDDMGSQLIVLIESCSGTRLMAQPLPICLQQASSNPSCSRVLFPATHLPVSTRHYNEPAFLTTWRDEVRERAVRTRRDLGGGKRRAQHGLERFFTRHETRNTAFMLFTNHETRNTNHGLFIVCCGRQVVRNAG